jgi:hypothetical protein
MTIKEKERISETISRNCEKLENREVYHYSIPDTLKEIARAQLEMKG